MSITYKFSILLLIIFTYAVGVYGEKSTKNNTRVIGGHDANQPIPYQISLQVKTRKPIFSIPFLTENNEWAHICGGSIIGSRYVLTAAHCVEGADPKRMSVLVGTMRRNKGGTRYEVESFVMHPSYEPLKTGDLAVMKMKKPFEYTRNITPIELGEDFVGGDVPVKLSGWGYTRSITIGNLPETLQTIDLRTITKKECGEQGFNVTDGEICTYKGLLQGACAGDSGGPLVTEDRKTLVGIVSYGTAICSIGLPDAFTRVSTYVSWIREQMKAEKASNSEKQVESSTSKFVNSKPLLFADV